MHPPFDEGNLTALRHGATSPRLRDPLAAELVTQALEEVPYLAEVRYRAALHSWARCEAACILVEAWLAEQGITDEAGAPRAAMRTLADFTRLAQRERDALGLTPTSAARLDAVRERQADDRSVLELENYLKEDGNEDDAA